LNTDLILSEELYLELFCTLKAYIDVEYSPHPTGLCTFSIGLIDIVCIDVLALDIERDRFLIIFDINRLMKVLAEPFVTLKEMQDILDLVSNNIKTLKNIIDDTKRSYLRTMQGRMERWTPLHTQSLQDFLQLADADYWKFITDTY